MIRMLDWDSSFFGVKTGAVNVAHINELTAEDAKGFDFVYVFAEAKAEQLLPGFFLVDEKVTYVKELIESPAIPDASVISVPPGEEMDEELIELAYQAGEYSRFKADPVLPLSKFKDLYKLWMINSVKRSIAKEVFAVKENNVVKAMITLGIKNGTPDIGLIAVDRQYRGKGTGQMLMKAAEYWAVHIEKQNRIQVITQGLNIRACAFYEQIGYRAGTKQFIYHWWPAKAKQ